MRLFITIAILLSSFSNANAYNVSLIVFKQTPTILTEKSNNLTMLNKLSIYNQLVMPITNNTMLGALKKLTQTNIIFSGQIKLTNKNSNWQINNDLTNTLVAGFLTINKHVFFDCNFYLNIATNNITIPIKQKIRVKNNQINYIDNPLVGILLYIEE